jgi:Ser/Thr protein kinase RdoA (MazF antagonist)
VTPRLLAAVRERYGIAADGAARDLGGSSNLNLLLDGAGGERGRCVVRVYRTWVTQARLEAIQAARRRLAEGGVPCAQPLHTRDGATWIEADGRLVEAEPYVEHDAEMDTWERLEAGLPLLGRVHALLAGLTVHEDGRSAPASNNIAPEDVLDGVQRGTRHMREWDPSPSSAVELEMAAAADQLALVLSEAEHRAGVGDLPRQLVHGDYWDNNVLFREGRVVQVGDLDFMGERARIDDLALTLYYTTCTFASGAPGASNEHARRLRPLVDAYAGGLDEPLSPAERAALPLALARTPLCFVAMVPRVDAEAGARRLAAAVAPDLIWAHGIVRDLDQWQAAFH